MEVSVLLVVSVKLLFNSSSIHTVSLVPALFTVFECASYTHYKRSYKILASLDHDDKGITLVIHVVDVLFREVTSVKNDADVPVAQTIELLEHVLQLGDVDNRTLVDFIGKGFVSIYVVENGNVEYRLPEINLCLAEFNEVNVPGLACLVRRVVGKIDNIFFLLCIPVPPVYEAGHVITVDMLQHSGHFSG